MNWRLYLRMLGVSVHHAEKMGIVDNCSFSHALLDGSIMQVKGVAFGKYKMLAEAAEYPLPRQPKKGPIISCGEVIDFRITAREATCDQIAAFLANMTPARRACYLELLQEFNPLVVDMLPKELAA